MKIAIIEDSYFMRRVTVLTLKTLYPDAELFEFADAEKALKAIREVAPDLITLDLLMPGIGGLEFLLQVKQQEIHARIVVITADVQPIVRDRCLAAGAHGFVEKPITPNKLRAALGESPVPS